MKTTASYLRIIVYMVLAFFFLEFIVDSGEEWAITKYPIIWVILGLVLFLAIAMEIVISAMQRVLYAGLNEEAKKRYSEMEESCSKERFAWFKEKYNKMLSAKPIANETEIIMDHNYDGIRELDNKLPPWWTYLFYVSIVFAVSYLVYYEVFDGPGQVDEYNAEVAKANEQIAEYKKNNKDLIATDNVELMTEPSDLAAGKEIYTANCVACHKEGGGGGIGPNLTDEYWILGGGIKNVFHTVSEGGRPGKGMIPWKTDLKPLEIAQVSSYLLTLQGTNPPDGKEPEGEIWVDDSNQY